MAKEDYKACVSFVEVYNYLSSEVIPDQDTLVAMAASATSELENNESLIALKGIDLLKREVAKNKAVFVDQSEDEDLNAITVLYQDSGKLLKQCQTIGVSADSLGDDY